MSHEPQTLGRYSVLGKIGAGGMAEVFLARSRGAQGTEKLLVLKKIHPTLARNRRFIDMFVDEARVAMRLNHSNIVQVYAFEHIDDAYVLAMEYVDGLDLLDLSRRAGKHRRPLPFGLAAFIIAEAAKGLDYAHSRRDDHGEPLEIVHRDVSPQNILISREGAVKVTDFGIARARWLHEESAEAIKGKLGYMSPEQASRGRVDRRTDIFALGVVLQELITGRRLLQVPPGEDPLPILIEARHPTPIEINPNVPLELDAIVRRAMSRRPEDRFGSARELAVALASWLHTLPELFDAQTLELFLGELLPRPAAPGASPATGTIDPVTGGREVAVTAQLRPAAKEVERRPTVVTAARLEIDPGPHRGEILAALNRLVGEMVYKAEGVFQEVPGGFRIYLGLGGSSIEDGIRGLRLAYDILDVVGALALDHHVAMQASLAVQRGHVRVERDAQGTLISFESEPAFLRAVEQVLDAARPGEIVAGPAVYRLARREFHFEPVVTFQGSSDDEADEAEVQLAIWRVLGTKSRNEMSRVVEGHGLFFGREEDLGRLRAALDAARGGHLKMLTLEGDLGIGKSRLVSRFLGTLMPGAVDLMEAACIFAERDTPLAAAVAVLRAVLGLPEGDPGERLHEALCDVLDGAPHYLARQERILGELVLSPEAAWGSDAARQRFLVRRSAFGLAVLLGLRSRRRPAILVVDNAQWLDGPSIDVLSELASARADLPLLVLLVGQPGTLAGRRIVGLETLVLRELPDQVLRQIVVDRLGHDDSLSALSDQITTRAQGNPYFAVEIIESLVEQGVLVPVPGRARQFRQSRPDVVIRLPATMEGLAASRVDGLPPELRTVLRASSAIAAAFDAKLLGDLVGRDVAADLAELVRRDLLLAQTHATSQTVLYRFRQPMIREAAYAGLANEDLTRLHRALAEALIARAAGGSAVPTMRIAWHLQRSGDNERAGRYYLQAGNEAMAIYSGRQALKLYDRAVPLFAPHSVERFQSLARREKLLRTLGRHKDREADIAELERLGARHDEPALEALAANRRAQLLFDLADFAGASQSLARSQELAERAGDIPERVEALRLTAYVSAEEGHLVRALDACERALALLPADDSLVRLKGKMLAVKSHVLLAMGYLLPAPAVLAEALLVAHRQGMRRLESQVVSNLALLRYAHGDLMEAIDLLERAMRIDAEIRDVSARGTKLAVLGQIRVELGDFVEARRNLTSALVSCRDSIEPIGEIEAELGLAELELWIGEGAAARARLEAIASRESVERSRILLTRHRQLLAMALLATGAVQAARRVAESAFKIAFAAGMNGETVHGGVRLGLVLAEMQLFGEAGTVTRRAMDLLAALGSVRRASEVHWMQAQIYHRAGSAHRAALAETAARGAVERRRAGLASPRLRAFFDAHPLTRAIDAGLAGSRTT